MKITYQITPTDNKNDDNIIIAVHEKWKYQLMWALRTIENEMNIPGGEIIIKSDEEKTEFHVEGFSDELTIKIYDMIMSVDFKFPLLESDTPATV